MFIQTPNDRYLITKFSHITDYYFCIQFISFIPAPLDLKLGMTFRSTQLDQVFLKKTNKFIEVFKVITFFCNKIYYFNIRFKMHLMIFNNF